MKQKKGEKLYINMYIRINNDKYYKLLFCTYYSYTRVYIYIYLYEIYLLSCFRFGQNVGISFETRRTPRNQDINKRVYKFNALGFSMVARREINV